MNGGTVLGWAIFCLTCISIEAVQKKPGGTGQGVTKANLLSLQNAVNALKDDLKDDLNSIRDEVSNLRDDVSNLRDGVSSLRDGESNVRDNVLELIDDMTELKKQLDCNGGDGVPSKEMCNATLVAAELKEDLSGLNEKMKNISDKCQLAAVPGKYGEGPLLPGLTCLDIQRKRLPEIVPSGVYWMTLGSSGVVYQLYCDMETDDGGWTLVWTYTFTNYASFTSHDNAVTPRPSWDDTGYKASCTPVSTTPPLSETQLGALEFAKWKQIGNEFMIKSNINQWIACTPVGGSFVDWRFGSLNCRMVKVVASAECTTVVPNKITLHKYGPSLEQQSNVYYFDTSLSANWPTHDPCGTNFPKHLTGVNYTRGNVFVR
ncbi:unnamed protein product [Owenia fusiformis]|uniref:Uncharacterized protein n=1 Tax=Owenia fusiformis TaxID=6347 RepID=A0A8J1U2F1_OWEFU|nr:unnamed protein product [Owenia fusiformis]